MKKILNLLVLGMFVLSLSGCGQTKVPENVADSCVAIEQSGEICAYVAGEFEIDWYDVEELKNMAEEEAVQYNNKAGSDLVKIKDVYLNDDKTVAVVSYVFKDASVYSDFLGEEFFYGTVEEALSKGYSITANLKEINKDDFITPQGIKDKGQKYILITDIKEDIYLPGAPAYVSEGVTSVKGTLVNTSDCTTDAVILMK